MSYEEQTQPTTNTNLPTDESEPREEEDFQEDSATTVPSIPWYHEPITSLAIDQAVSSRLPPDSIALLFWHNPLNSGAVLAVLIMAHAFLFLNLGISKISLVCALAEYALIICVVVDSVYKLVDKYLLKNDPPRNLIDMHIGFHVRKARATVEAVIPTREELINGLHNILDKMIEVADAFGALCLSTNLNKVLPIVVALHFARTAFYFVSLTRLYYLSVIFFFTVPYAYGKYKYQVDAAVCPKLEQARLVIVTNLDRVWEKIPERVKGMIGKSKAE